MWTAGAGWCCRPGTCGCSGGGLDALGLHLSQKGAKFTIGQFNLIFNAVLFLLCGLLFDVSTMIYSILNTIFQAVAIDRAHQQSVNVQMLIFTKEESPELDRFILDNLHRGITRWEGEGVYTLEVAFPDDGSWTDGTFKVVNGQ